MKIVWRLVALAVLATVAFWLYTIFFPSPEKLIRRRLTQVEELASFEKGEGLIPRALSLQKLGECFAPEVEIVLDWREGEHVVAGRQEILERAAAVRQAFQALKVEFLDKTVSLAADGESADVALTARVRVPGDKDFFVQEMKFSLKKIDGEWLVIRVETIKTLSRVMPAGSRNGLNHNLMQVPVLRRKQIGALR